MGNPEFAKSIIDLILDQGAARREKERRRNREKRDIKSKDFKVFGPGSVTDPRPARKEKTRGQSIADMVREKMRARENPLVSSVLKSIIGVDSWDEVDDAMNVAGMDTLLASYQIMINRLIDQGAKKGDLTELTQELLARMRKVDKTKAIPTKKRKHLKRSGITDDDLDELEGVLRKMTVFAKGIESR